MDFSYSEEQTLLSNSLRRLLGDTYDGAAWRKLEASEIGYSEDAWRQYAELGLLGLPFPEAAGGFDGTSVDVMIVARELGRALTLEPYVATVIMGGGAVRLAGSAEQQAEILPAVAEGKLKLAAAILEPQSRYDLFDVATRADSDGSGYTLHGQKAVVLGADAADKIVIAARTSGDTFDRDGISLFLVDADAPGLEKRSYRLCDGRGAAELMLDGVKVDSAARLGGEGDAADTIEHIADLARAALCAEAIGAWERVNEMTLDYLKTREQFGRPIGRFQVLQHRMVDMTLEYEHAKSLVYLAGMEADNTDANARARAVSAAKAFMAYKGREAGEHAVQMHGGIGMTKEYMLSDCVRRFLMIEHTLGDEDYHVARFADTTPGAS